MANELPLELVLAIARRAWTLDDEKERASGAPPREFGANAKPEALERLAEFIETFIEEATHRACALADVEGARAVDGGGLGAKGGDVLRFGERETAVHRAERANVERV